MPSDGVGVTGWQTLLRDVHTRLYALKKMSNENQRTARENERPLLYER